MIKGILNDEATADRLVRLDIGCPFAASDGPGAGFLETVYANALDNRVRKGGFSRSATNA
jgi:hypothetical protein